MAARCRTLVTALLLGAAAGACTTPPAERLAAALQATAWESPIPTQEEIQDAIVAGRPGPPVGDRVEFRPDSVVVFRGGPGLELTGRYRVVDSLQVHVQFTGGLAGMLLGERTLQVRLSADGDTLRILPNPLALGPGPGVFVPVPGGGR